MLESGLAAVAAAAGFAILYHVPHGQVWRCGLIGGGGWIVYLATGDIFGLVGAAFLAAGVIALLSEILARRVHQPVIVFLIPGVIPLVPGAQAYITMLSFLENDFLVGIESLVSTVFISGAIAGGIILVSSIFRAIAWTKKRKEAVI